MNENITYNPSFTRYPEKEKHRLPVMRGLPLFPEDTPAIKRFFLAPFKRRKYLITVDYFTYIDHIEMWVCVPKGYIYDIASIPTFLPGAAHDGPLMYGALPHDFIYWYGGLFLSKGPGYSFQFQQIDRLSGDMIFCTMNNKSNKMKRWNNITRIILNKFGAPNYKQHEVDFTLWDNQLEGV